MKKKASIKLKYSKETYLIFSFICIATVIFFCNEAITRINRSRVITNQTTCVKVEDITTTNRPKYIYYYADGYSEKSEIFYSIREGEKVNFNIDKNGNRLNLKDIKYRIWFFFILSFPFLQYAVYFRLCSLELKEIKWRKSRLWLKKFLLI